MKRLFVLFFKKTVVALMGCNIRKIHKVLRSVVINNFIYMMDLFTFYKRSTKNFSHNQSVLSNVTMFIRHGVFWFVNKNITSTVFRSTSFPITMFRTLLKCPSVNNMFSFIDPWFANHGGCSTFDRTVKNSIRIFFDYGKQAMKFFSTYGTFFRNACFLRFMLALNRTTNFIRMFLINKLFIANRAYFGFKFFFTRFYITIGRTILLMWTFWKEKVFFTNRTYVHGAPPCFINLLVIALVALHCQDVFAFSESWDESVPDGSTEAMSQVDDRIREFKTGIRERLDEDHAFYSDETGHSDVGYHKALHMIDETADTSDVETFYNKSGDIWWHDADGNKVRITANGAVGPVICVQSGSAAGPSINFDTDSNTGFYLAGSDTIGFSTGGTARASIGVPNDDILVVTNSGTGDNLFLDQDGNGKAIYIDSEATTAAMIYADMPVADHNYSFGIYHGGAVGLRLYRDDTTDDGEVLNLGNAYLWVDSTGDLRIDSSLPSSDTGGTVIGSQS